jgi:1,4-alpha-glucan branching enzyme
MSLKKQFLKSKPECKVTFKIPKEVSGNHKKASLVGDFNNWDAKKHTMKKLKTDGSFSITLNLETGKAYQFRYLLDDEKYVNEPAADKQVVTHFGDSENSLLEL